MPQRDSEQTPLLQNGRTEDSQNKEVVSFEEEDKDNPKQWPLRWKYTQVVLIFMIGLICPLASAIQAPAADEIAATFGTNKQMITGALTGFLCMLGIGPLFFAPMSETFGRRPVFMINLTIFTILQIPVALAPNAGVFIALRTLSGLFGSVGVANGGGSISDLFEASERATVLGFYLLGPLLGPTLGPLFGGISTSRLHWRWIFWVVFIVAAIVTVVCFFLLHETYAVSILAHRKKELEKQNPETTYRVDGASDQPVFSKIVSNSNRSARILLTQPIVMTMSLYQALIFSSMYTLYTSYENIWSSSPYNFTQLELGLSYLAPATGFIITAIFLVPMIDKLYNRLAKRSKDETGVPEYRLPLANIGAVFLPISLFWFGWTVQYGKPWPVPLAATLLFGASQVSIFNTCQNYYIDAFETYAASALAAGAFLRSIVGGLVPLFIPKVFDRLGYGWGLSIFGFLSVAIMPAPLLFYFYGAKLRSKFAIDL